MNSWIVYKVKRVEKVKIMAQAAEPGRAVFLQPGREAPGSDPSSSIATSSGGCAVASGDSQDPVLTYFEPACPPGLGSTAGRGVRCPMALQAPPWVVGSPSVPGFAVADESHAGGVAGRRSRFQPRKKQRVSGVARAPSFLPEAINGRATRPMSIPKTESILPPTKIHFLCCKPWKRLSAYWGCERLLRLV